MSSLLSRVSYNLVLFNHHLLSIPPLHSNFVLVHFLHPFFDSTELLSEAEAV